MLGFEILYNSDVDFKEVAKDYARDYIGSDSYDFAEKWLLHDHVTQDGGILQSNVSENSSDAFTDSRENLESEIRGKVAYGTSTLMYPPSANKVTQYLPSLSLDTVLGWLDRQAAITEAKVEHKWSCYEGSVQAEIDRLNLCIAELAAKPRSDLAQRMEVDSLENRIFDQQNRIAELQAQVDELTADRDKAANEREMYRKKLAHAVDNAHDTCMLMDEGMA